jgi:hypothetical protein
LEELEEIVENDCDVVVVVKGSDEMKKIHVDCTGFICEERCSPPPFSHGLFGEHERHKKRIITE